MAKRLLILTVLFAAAWGAALRGSRPERVPPREPLASVPYEIGTWKGEDTEPFAPDVLAALGVDEYVSRIYTNAPNSLASLYIGYYKSQRAGDTIHSPLNCLPGAGWEPIQQARTSIAVSGHDGPILVNRFLIQKGLDKQVVIYWYQSHGRVIASEYWSKALLVYDAARLNRSDAALVRVISPVLPSEETDGPAGARATAFVQALFPQLGRFLPS